jgi:two-component system LytT family response regulator
VKKIRVLIVQGLPEIRATLREMVAREKDLALVGEHQDGYAGLGAIRQERPSLVFLGTEPGGIDGFKLLEMAGNHAPRAVIFVSRHENHAVRAFSSNAVDYLVEPFTRKRFQQAVKRARRRLARLARGRQSAGADRGPDSPRLIGAKVGGRILLLQSDQIEMIVARRSYSTIHIRNAAHRVRSSLSALQQRLPPGQFIRINRSTLINAAHVREITRRPHGDGRVRLDNGQELPLSRRYRAHWSALTRLDESEDELDDFIERALAGR